MEAAFTSHDPKESPGLIIDNFRHTLINLQKQLSHAQQSFQKLEQVVEKQQQVIIHLATTCAQNAATSRKSKCQPSSEGLWQSVPIKSTSGECHDLLGLGDSSSESYCSSNVTLDNSSRPKRDGPIVFTAGPAISKLNTSDARETDEDENCQYINQRASAKELVTSCEFPIPTEKFALLAPPSPPQTPQPDRFNSYTSNRKSPYSGNRGGFTRHREPCDGHREDYWRYGIRYMPLSTQANILQRVLITNLPPHVTLIQLFAKIRGGLVVDAQLLDTCPLTGGASALVRFLDEDAARSYAAFASARSILVCGQRLHVQLLSTPTYPLPANRAASLFRHGRTRCLRVCNWPGGVRLAALRRDIRPCVGSEFDAVESIFESHGELEVRMTGVHHAGSAYGVLTKFRAYRTCSVDFIADPCAGPLEELLDSEDIKDHKTKSNDSLTSCSESEKDEDFVVRNSTDAQPLGFRGLGQSIWA